jgi:hypothetical protein
MVEFITTEAPRAVDMANSAPKDPELFVTPFMEDKVFEKVPVYPLEVAAQVLWTQTWITTGTPDWDEPVSCTL